ncbi:ankyrin repeat domain-containing protein 60 [Microcaecilia unicolor]|uniref:Ankyrin repeat domain-containing protein 60 n=1 Tax=Microcaecilia unicolor TaxID=1415580 RepID=A0A6P7YPZ6_9AMPH|nr:ankyrin repeat domain-containing protein 60 [Microcaecilia unicolor]
MPRSAPAPASRRSGPGPGRLGGTEFSLRVRLQDTGELFTLRGCHQSTTIAQLKDALELVAGIPSNFQRLCYLDEGDLPDVSTLKFNDVVPGGTITLRIWYQDGWRDLVKAAAEGNVLKLKCLGVTKDSTYCTAHSERLNPDQKSAWIAHRAFAALYISAHRGNLEAVKFLLQSGTSVLAKTPLGRSALHAAAAMGRSDCIDELIAHGAQIQDPDKKGCTALDLVRLWGHKQTERRLYLSQWKQRAAGITVKFHLDESELFAHQKFDSKLKTWRSGTYCKRYMANLLKPGEFQSSHFNAPRNQSYMSSNLGDVKKQPGVSAKFGYLRELAGSKGP